MNQVYLVEEDQANRRARKKAGGNSGKRYTEGWVEFEDKKIARGQSFFSAEKFAVCGEPQASVDPLVEATYNLQQG